MFLALAFSFVYIISLHWISGWDPIKLELDDLSSNTFLQTISPYNFNGTWEAVDGNFNKSIKNFDSNEGKSIMKILYFKPRRSLYNERADNVSGVYRVFLTLLDGDYNTNNFGFKINFDDNDVEGNDIKITKELTKTGSDYKQIGGLRRMQI